MWMMLINKESSVLVGNIILYTVVSLSRWGLFSGVGIESLDVIFFFLGKKKNSECDILVKTVYLACTYIMNFIQINCVCMLSCVSFLLWPLNCTLSLIFLCFQSFLILSLKHDWKTWISAALFQVFIVLSFSGEVDLVFNSHRYVCTHFSKLLI